MDKKERAKAKKVIGMEPTEEVNEYGEFVPSFFTWMSPDEQRKNAEKLADPGKEQPGQKNS